MKSILKSLISLSLLLGLFACSSLPTEEDSSNSVKSSVKFTMQSIGATNSNILFSSTESETPSKVAISYKKSGEGEAETSTTIELTAFGNSYITDDVLSLYEGNYELTKFDVLNDEGATIYSTPKAGSEKAKDLNITTALAYGFEVKEGKISKVNMQVVAVTDTTDPADFGHAAFTLDLVDYNRFYIEVLVLDDSIGWVYTTAQVEVKNAEETIIKTASIDGKMNKILIANSDSYKITISKDGYASQELSFSKDDLEAYESKAMVIKLKKAENTHRYELIKQTMTWTEAKAYCESLGGHLATITSAEENAYIYNNIIVPNNARCWIGGTDKETENVWKWVTGEEWSYSKWHYGEPNNDSEDGDCLEIYTDGTWNDWTSVATNSYFICEWDGEDENNGQNENTEKTFYIEALSTEDGSTWNYTDATLNIVDEDEAIIYNNSISGEMNKIVVSDENLYKITISKDGYVPQTFNFTKDSLSNYENTALKVKLEKAEVYDTLNIGKSNAYLLDKGDSNKISLLLNVNEPKSIYFVLSNTSSSSTVSSSSYSVSSEDLAFSPSISNSIMSSKINEYNFEEPNLPAIPDFVEGSSLNRNIMASTIQASVSNGDTYNFYEAIKENNINATCRKVVSDISTNQGSKTLNIWVADNCWIDGGSKSNLITQAMVDAMADKFLKSGLDNDIYDWVTNICGAEWGSQKYSNLLSSDQAIDILLCDIGDDNSVNGGVLGYFWSGNNLLKSFLSTSNEKIMFCVDAPMYGTASGENWDLNDYLPKVSISTLAHEFQHMINFYQNNVLKNDVLQGTWLNELLSMSIEDLVACKIKEDYSSSPYYSRYCTFNYCNDYSLCKWDSDNSLPYYANHYSFGAYLLRQFDGANFVKNIYSSTNTNTEAIESVTGKSFSSIQRNWGAAYLLSDKGLTSGDFAYNADMSSSLNGTTYYLVKINAFDAIHSNSPRIFSLDNLQDVSTKANVYYKLADNLAVGTYKIKISLDDNLELTVVSK